MPRKLIITNDGSPSIEWEQGVTYHSIHGAIQESRHIFIREGLHAAWAMHRRERPPLRIFELGLGTGLNALLSLLEAAASQRPISYEAMEAFPLETPLTDRLDYCTLLDCRGYQSFFERLHQCDWEVSVPITPYFTFFKSRGPWPGRPLYQSADLVYYDAFDPVFQPELWTTAVFESLSTQLAPNALIVTYCCKGAVRRSLAAAGFQVEKIPGPPGKREMIRAIKDAG